MELLEVIGQKCLSQVQMEIISGIIELKHMT